jgi:DNA-binding XRE family transcriptional regulator
MPANLYTFSNKYQNTQLAFTLDTGAQTIITIDEGFYNPNELAMEITNKMNQSVAPGTDTSFNVYYNNVSQKLWFGHTSLPFTLDCSSNIKYTFPDNECEPPIIFNQYTNWGLPSYLGFDKKRYNSTPVNPVPKTFDYLPPTISAWTDPTSSDFITHYIEAPSMINIMGDRSIYMDVDKYNTMDELYPYTQSSTNDSYNFTGYSGKVNSAFAKIPVNVSYDKIVFDSRTLFLNNFAHYEPPIERIAKLKFTFRFHDGRLVDVKDCPFDFTLEFNSLKNEIGKVYNVRVPHTYLI